MLANPKRAIELGSGTADTQDIETLSTMNVEVLPISAPVDSVNCKVTPPLTSVPAVLVSGREHSCWLRITELRQESLIWTFHRRLFQKIAPQIERLLKLQTP